MVFYSQSLSFPQSKVHPSCRVGSNYGIIEHLIHFFPTTGIFKAIDLESLPDGAAKWADRVNVFLDNTTVRLVTYQLSAVCLMLFRALGDPDLDTFDVPAVGTVLGDEAGLGKTVQAIVFAAMLQAELLRRGHPLYPVLIIVPSNGVLEQWLEWMRIFFHDSVATLSGAERHLLDYDNVRAFIATAATVSLDFNLRSRCFLNPHTRVVQEKPWPDQDDIDAVRMSRAFKTDKARQDMIDKLTTLANGRKKAAKKRQRSLVYQSRERFITIIDEAHTTGCEIKPRKNHSGPLTDNFKEGKLSFRAVVKIPSIVTCPLTATPLQNTNGSVLSVLIMANLSATAVELPVTVEMMANVIRRTPGTVHRQLKDANRSPPDVEFSVLGVPCDSERQLAALDTIDRQIAEAQAKTVSDGTSTFVLFAAIQSAIKASLFFNIFDAETAKLTPDVPVQIDDAGPTLSNIEQKINRTLRRHFSGPLAAPAIIACSYIEGCNRLKRVIEANNQLRLWDDEKQLRVQLYNGDLPQCDRARVLQLFAKNEVDVLIMTPQSGGTGLNLAAASLMIVVGCGWNAAAEHQMRQRIVRFGSPHKMVRIVRVALDNSISSWMAKVAADKQAMAQELLGGPDDEPVYGGDECFYSTGTMKSFRAMARQLVQNLKKLAANRRADFMAKSIGAAATGSSSSFAAAAAPSAGSSFAASAPPAKPSSVATKAMAASMANIVRAGTPVKVTLKTAPFKAAGRPAANDDDEPKTKRQRLY